MAQRKTLTEGQIAVLQWVQEGCPEGSVEVIPARISAAALRNRGLVTTTGHGPAWTAAITQAGKEYLAKADGPNPPQPRQANVSVTQQLVDKVIDAGGALRVPRKDWYDKDQIDYARRARLAEMHGKVPAGYRLAVKLISGDELSIELVADVHGLFDATDGSTTLAAIPVPERLGKPHAAAREFRDRTGLHEISRKTLPRAVRIVHALAIEAERRGYTIGCVEVHEDSYGRSDWKPAKDGQLAFTINGHELALRIWEKGAGFRGPYERAMNRWRQDRKQPFRVMQFVDRPRPYDSGATGELNLTAVGYTDSRQGTWGDRSRWKLEDRLANALRELELQAAEAEERRLARERELAERQRQWEAAVQHAKQRLIDDHRAEVLRNRVRAWHEAEEIRAYCNAVEIRHGMDVVANDNDATAWLTLARELADRIQQLPRLPADPEPTPEALKPYMGKWNPYGAHGW